MVISKDAPIVWKLLKGIVCLYKPSGVTAAHVRNTVIGNLCRDLCALECRPPMNHVFIEGNPLKSLSVEVAPSYADHPLVVGPRYQPQDFRLTWSAHLGKHVSGVFVIGINKGAKTALELYQQKPSRVYRVKGKLGQATENYFDTGKIVEKATFHHIKRTKFDALLASLQAAHQKQMFAAYLPPLSTEHRLIVDGEADLYIDCSGGDFRQCGVDMQTQTAYELATQGPIKPAESKIPILYGIKCIHFEPPDFTLEMQCINEYEEYFGALIHDIGMKARSVATCTGVQCIRYDCFTLEHSLLRKHWTLEYIVNNMLQCTRLLKETNSKQRRLSPALIDENKFETIAKIKSGT